MKRRFPSLVMVVLGALLLSACGNQPTQWKTKKISGLMPDLKFTLSNENGKKAHAKTYQGKIKVLYFGYTHCPDVCPLTLGTLARALQQLGDRADAVRVLFVSVDPKRDKPATLREYTAAFGPRFVGLTGTQDQLKKLSKRYRVSYSYGKPGANGSYNVNHSSALFVFGRKGKVKLLMNRRDGAGAIAHDLAQLIQSG